MLNTKLIQKNASGRIKFIDITWSKDKVLREWGLLGGNSTQITENQYNYINHGKANQLDPEEAAMVDYHRIIKKKKKEGYIETGSFSELPELENASDDLTDLLTNIPTQFCCSKPTAKIPDKKLAALIKSGNARFFMKYNGLCHYILVTLAGDVKIYTRRMDDHTVKYPTLAKEIKDRQLPPGSIFICELCVDPELGLPHMKAFELMSSISKSNVHNGKPKSDLSKNFARQDTANGGHRVRAAVFGVLYLSCKQVWDLPYGENLELFNGLFSDISAGTDFFIPEELAVTENNNIREFIRKNKKWIEGLVVFDTSQAMEVTMNGKPKRRAGYKLKESDEIDVIAFDFTPGTGKLQGKIGSLKIGLFDKTGKVRLLGSVGSGLKPEHGDCDIASWSFPQVIEIEYDQIFPTGAFQFPRFVKKHEDKILAETITYEEHMEKAA